MTYGLLFPSLRGRRPAKVDLDRTAQVWLKENNVSGDPSPFLDPARAQGMIDDLHRRLGVDWSWGSYLEDRSHLLRGCYMDQTGGYLHLGIDCNVPGGTPVAAPFDCAVMNVFDDRDIPCGWGPRLLLRVANGTNEGDLVILSHFSSLEIKVGARFKAGQQIGTVGIPPFNGVWWPHLHIQCLVNAVFEDHRLNDFALLDGYGHPSNIEALKASYPDPSWVIQDLL